MGVKSFERGQAVFVAHMEVDGDGAAFVGCTKMYYFTKCKDTPGCIGLTSRKDGLLLKHTDESNTFHSVADAAAYLDSQFLKIRQKLLDDIHEYERRVLSVISDFDCLKRRAVEMATVAERSDA